MNAPTRRIKPAYKLDKSTAHFQRAVKSMPLGVSSNFRFWGEGKTVYVKRGRGARLWDFDDNCYIDYRLGYGPAILGHCHPEVDAAAREGQEVGTVFALGTEREVVVAEMISEMVPAAELVRFSNSGTEAVMAALRLARGATGRDHYVTFEGSYHGLFDATMWTADMANMTDAVKGPEVVSYGKGIPQLVRQLFWQVPYNDANRLEDVLKQHGHTIAAVLIEPILGNCCGIPSKPEFIKAVRELCTKYDVLMIVDEVKTGFRVAKGGAQELYGIKADICTMAKAVANGYPIACIGGREDLMRHYGRGVAHGGTYTAQAMSLAAAEKTLTILRDTDGAGRHRRLWQGDAGRHRSHPLGPRRAPQLHRASQHERPVLPRDPARQLPGLEDQRLHLLRPSRGEADRARRDVRARQPRALVHLLGP